MSRTADIIKDVSDELLSKFKYQDNEGFEWDTSGAKAVSVAMLTDVLNDIACQIAVAEDRAAKEARVDRDQEQPEY